jgi:hypothetical protein
MVRDIMPMNGDLKRPYVISATKRDTLRRHAKERRYQIYGSFKVTLVLSSGNVGKYLR